MAHLPKLSWDVSTRYDRLPLEGVCFAEYIWLGAHEDVDIRSKTKTLYVKPNSLSDFPVWNFDGKLELASLSYLPLHLMLVKQATSFERHSNIKITRYEWFPLFP